MSFTASEIAHALHGRKVGRRWMVRCPAHEDTSPSCSIGEDSSGKLLVHCFSGCRQQDVIAALKARGLWPDRPRRDWTPEAKRQWGRTMGQARGLATQVQHWMRGRRDYLESQKQLAWDHLLASHGSWFWTWATASRELYELESADAATLVRRFREAKHTNPQEAFSWVSYGRRLDAADYRLGRFLVSCLAKLPPPNSYAN